MSDLISRKAAIDVLCQAGCGSCYCGISCDDVKAIEQLPSVHPISGIDLIELRDRYEELLFGKGEEWTI